MSLLAAQAPIACSLWFVIFASLPVRHGELLDAAPRITGGSLRRLYIVGGSSQNTYPNALIGQRTGVEVIRGPVESATVGNLAVQFAALEAGPEDQQGFGVSPARVADWAPRLSAARASLP